MTKKIFLATLVAALYALGVNAQVTHTEYNDSTMTVTYNDDKYKVETNYFWENWFITLQGGAQMFFGDHCKQMDFKDRITPAATVSIGKWFTPTFGI